MAPLDLRSRFPSNLSLPATPHTICIDILYPVNRVLAQRIPASRLPTALSTFFSHNLSSFCGRHAALSLGPIINPSFILLPSSVLAFGPILGTSPVVWRDGYG
uniref:Uncharacterized protein n=1 Tax=Bionectria ochroleuca TaxID=29856 RepID=A0A8H7NJK0_BIOOC